jgi:hypothetical protein
MMSANIQLDDFGPVFVRLMKRLEVDGGGVNGLPPGVAKMRIVSQKEDKMDVDGHVESLHGATMQTSSALMESALAGQPGQEPNQDG